MMINVLCWVSALVVLIHVIGIAGKIGNIHSGRRAIIAAQWSLQVRGFSRAPDARPGELQVRR